MPITGLQMPNCLKQVTCIFEESRLRKHSSLWALTSGDFPLLEGVMGNESVIFTKYPGPNTRHLHFLSQPAWRGRHCLSDNNNTDPGGKSVTLKTTTSTQLFPKLSSRTCSHELENVVFRALTWALSIAKAKAPELRLHPECRLV